MMELDEAIKHCLEVAEQNDIQADKWQEEGGEEWGKTTACRECAAEQRQLAEWLRELKEAKRLVAQLKAKLCDSSEYCAYCDELDMSERDHFTCKYKKKKIPAVCYWQVLTPAHFDDIPWTKNETLNLIGDEPNGI